MSLAELHRRLADDGPRTAPERSAAALLSAVSVAYGAAVAVRNAAYDLGLLPVRRAGVSVVKVGALSAGGTGKTPLAAEIARRLVSLGQRPLLVARGYGAPAPGGAGPRLVSEGEGPPRATWREVGEEAMLLTHLAPGVPVAVARAPEQALVVARRAGLDPTVLVIDGGHQHRRLHADLACVTLDASRRPGAGRLLPRGDLRESWRALRRGHLVVLHRHELCADTDAWERWLDARAPGLPRAWVRNVWSEPATAGGRRRSWEELRAQRLGVWTALARPGAFLAGLERRGIRPARTWIERDHAPFDAARADLLREAALRDGLDGFLVTEKDAIKIDTWPADAPPVLAVGARLDFVAGEAALEGLLRDRVGTAR
jgi:tetraacyldisaccharide 4'-kinase